MFEYWAFACLERDGICFAKKYPNTLEKMSVVVSQVEFVEERQLGWEPDVALGVFGQVHTLLGCVAMWQIIISRSLLQFPEF